MEKVVITTTSFAEYDNTPLDLLSMYSVVMNPHRRKLKPEEVVDLALDASGIVAGTETLDASTLEKLTTLKVISRVGTGVDNIDRAAADRLGIRIFNTPDAPTLAVSELTVALILNLLRKVSLMDRHLRGGIWDKCMGTTLHGKNVGIIGLGRIGKKVAQLLNSFGCHVSFADPCVSDCPECTCSSLEELLTSSDIVSIHASTKDRILSAEILKTMKKGVYILNMSRSGVVDYTALYDMLRDGHIAGAALDVFPEEPYEGPLRELDNVILTPHAGSYAKECRVEMEIMAIKNLLSGLRSDTVEAGALHD